MKILIGGGSGYIGTALCQVLIKKGHDVTVVSRKSAPNTVTWEEIKQNGLPAQYDAVVNLAGESEQMLNPFKKWDDEFKGLLRSSRVDTTKALAEAISSSPSPPEVYVSSSAVSYYKPDADAVYTEDSPGGDFDFLSSVVTDWEAAAAIPGDKHIRQVTIRIGIVLSRHGGAIAEMYTPFYYCLGGRVGSGKQWYPWIHLDDIVGMYVHAIENKDTSGIFNGVAPNTVTNERFTKAFASAMNRFAIFPIPAFIVNYMLGSERAKVVLEGPNVIPQRVLESGFEFKFPDIKLALDDICK